MKTFKEYVNEGKKFHPIDVFQERWVITNGKDILGTDGEIVSIKEFKSRMKNLKKHDAYDDIFFPNEKMADEVYKELDMSKPYEVKKLS